jgi:hypothetical protein
MAKMNSVFGKEKRWTSEVKVQYISSKAKNRPAGGRGDGNYYSNILLMPQILISVIIVKDKHKIISNQIGLPPMGSILLVSIQQS